MSCEQLPIQVCAFSVSSSGARCVLEKSVLTDGDVQYECQVSFDRLHITVHVGNGIFYLINVLGFML